MAYFQQHRASRDGLSVPPALDLAVYVGNWITSVYCRGICGLSDQPQATLGGVPGPDVQASHQC